MTDSIANQTAVPEPGYAAFISYSHADARIAIWLQGAIERYAVPRRLVGRVTRFGPIPRRLGKCFRDRDELPASADLKAEILAAIAQCRFMIVICSPAAAASPWVDQEILAFKRRRGAEPIIAVITDGEPFAAADAAETECFPKALRFQLDEHGNPTDRPAEPIAADLRPGKDTRRTALLKVLAGMLGIGLDELVRREAQRRQRIYGWVAASAVLMSTAFAGLAVMAWHERNVAIAARAKAAERRTQAEGLIEFMITDLHERLEPVGRLDVLDSVSTKAMDYFSRLTPTEMSGTSAGQKTRVLLLIGENQIARGEQGKALRTFLEAAKNAEMTLARDPENNDRLFEYSNATNHLGLGYYNQSDYENALYYFINASIMHEKLISFGINSSDKYLQDVAVMYRNIGTVYFKTSKLDDAKRYLEKSLYIAKSQFEKHNDSRDVLLDYAQSLAWLADVERLTGASSTALSLRQQELFLYQEFLARVPTDKSFIRSQMVAQRALAFIKVDKGNFVEAIDDLVALEIKMNDEYRFDEKNANMLFRLAKIDYDIAYASISAGYIKIAIQYLNLAKSRTLELEKLTENKNNFVSELDKRSSSINAQLFFSVGNYEKAIKTAQPSLKDLESKKSESSESILELSDALITALVCAQAFERTGDIETSQKIYKQINAKIEEYAPPRSIVFEALRAKTLPAIGRAEEAMKSLELICRSDFRRIVGQTACSN